MWVDGEALRDLGHLRVVRLVEGLQWRSIIDGDTPRLDRADHDIGSNQTHTLGPSFPKCSRLNEVFLWAQPAYSMC